MRQNTFEPGAARASFSTSAVQSTANRGMPSAKARAISRSFSMGSCFDCASLAEIQMALAAGASPERVSYGNTIKKEREIARAFALGIRLFAVDCSAEVEKIARAAPGAKVFCRILYDC